MRFSVTSALAFVGVASTAARLGAQQSAADPFAALDAEIPRLIEEAGVPGISAALVLDGEIAWSGAFGVADAATGARVTERTVFQAASLTKQVFAYTVLRLVDHGVLDLDTPLAEYLPYPRLEGEEAYPRITARHALSHSTGLPNWGGEHLELAFDPGTDFNYSGEGYVYLQRVVEHLTGMPLDRLVEREVLEPLGMHDSWIHWRADFDGRLAARHNDWGDSNGPVRPEEANAASSLHTTARDYARLLTALMDAEGLEPSTLGEALEPQIQVASRDQIDTTGRLYWGLGWGIQHGDAGRAIWQWGHNGGFRAYLLAYPDRRDAFVYFTNGDGGLSIGRDLLGRVGEVAGWPADEHHALTWLDYEPWDSPGRVARRRLVSAFRDEGIEDGMALFEELRADDADLVSDPFTAGVGRALGGMGETDAAIALLERNAELNTRGGNSLSVLGDVQLEAGLYHDALESYERALEIRPGHPIATRARGWTAEAVAALDDPPTLSGDPARFAGDYGPRHVTLEDGTLRYQRDGNPPYRLHPIDETTWLLDGLGTFRVRFVEEGGAVTKIEGLYVDGNSDETPRTP